LFTAIRRHWFGWLLFGYVLYALAFILNSSAVVDGRRYFLLFDDAMISMTYARNLAHGFGAVWFPGVDPVQGYSNPLWMLYMAAVHLLPLPPSLICLPIQLTGVAIICGTLYFIKRIVERLVAEEASPTQASDKMAAPMDALSKLTPFFAVMLTACYFPLNEWTLRGMEVGLLAFGITLSVWAALASAAGARYQWWLFPFLGLLTTIRMDAVVPGVVIVLWLAWAMPERRRSTLVVGAAWIGIFVVAQMLIQNAYYHDWLPNTYYLKVSGIPLTRRIPWGAYVLFCFLAGIGFWLLVLIALQMVVDRSKQVWLLAAVVAGQACYSVYVGGDAWEWWGGANRYLCVAMPMFFTLVALGVATFSRAFAAMTGWVDPQKTAGVMVALGLLTLLQVNCYQFDSYNSLKQCLLLDDPHELSQHESLLAVALSLRETTTPQARLAVAWAGILPYFSERPCVDLLGKNDRTIAYGPNNPIEPPTIPFFSSAPVPYCWPGHTKRDYRYSIREPTPDIIQPWHGMEEIDDVLKSQYISMGFGSEQFYVKKGSKEIKIQEAAEEQEASAKPEGVEN
jgi:arabinofuranosyltransferase